MVLLGIVAAIVGWVLILASATREEREAWAQGVAWTLVVALSALVVLSLALRLLESALQ